MTYDKPTLADSYRAEFQARGAPVFRDISKWVDRVHASLQQLESTVSRQTVDAYVRARIQDAEDMYVRRQLAEPLTPEQSQELWTQSLFPLFQLTRTAEHAKPGTLRAMHLERMLKD